MVSVAKDFVQGLYVAWPITIPLLIIICAKMMSIMLSPFNLQEPIEGVL
jgi:hypothetical protein